ncbi:MAG: SH3 domain-containing protein [Herpetosiphonaceae bacterium]|nr:SH3 domain-containing protein [Herpetosiphonaceae bacterium]
MRHEKSSSDLIHVDHDLQDFQQRAVENENQIPSLAATWLAINTRAKQSLGGLPQKVRRTPHRYFLHLLILLILPVGLVVSRTAAQPVVTVAADPAPEQAHAHNQPRPVLGATVMTNRNEPSDFQDEAPAAGDGPISDPDFDDALVIPASRPVDVKPATPTTTVSAELANLRNGPGTEFDRLDKLQNGSQLEVLSRHADWVEVRTEGGQTGWLAIDVLDLDEETIAALPEPAALPTPPPARVATISQESLNLRDGPGTDYISLVKLSSGLEVSLVAQYEGWYQVETPDGNVGWVSAEYLGMLPGVPERITVAESIPSSNPALVGYATDEGVNLRSGPSTKFESLGKLSNGAELSLLARHESWIKVETARGTKGWISADLVDVSSFVKRRVPYTDNVPALPKPKPVAKPKATTPTTRSAQPAGGGGGGGAASGDVASLAWNFVGSRYVWGGESPSGFDCSGLTKYLYRQIGVSLPHSARGQYSSAYGTFIGSMNNLQPGDLLFFANTAGPGITHVGIYVGSGTMINAMTPRSGVGAVSIYDRYWSSHYYGALRPYR